MNISNPKQASLAVIAVCVLLMIGAAVFSMVVPPADAAKAAEKARAENDELFQKIRRANDDLNEATQVLADRSWQEDIDEITPKLLAQATSIAEVNRLEVRSFRPQRIVDNGGLNQLTYLLTVEGAYPNVMAAAKALQDQAEKVAVTQIQIASSDTTSDMVTASIGLAAFQMTAEKEADTRG